LRKKWRKHNLRLKLFEQKLLKKKYKIVAGIDEAGRGPLAGPVVACAVIVRDFRFTTKIFDSKKLSTSARQYAFKEIIQKSYVGVGIVNNDIIDTKNILQATIIAIKKALFNLRIMPEILLIDGVFKPEYLPYPAQFVIQGDSKCFSIACASIIAKVLRDNLMTYYSTLYPEYNFERNRGYCTKQHIKAIKRYGLSAIHRLSFRPIQRLMSSENIKFNTAMDRSVWR
jgi:ribonuclease HII